MQPRLLDARDSARRPRRNTGPDQRHLREIGDGEQAGAQPVVDVVIVVGDVVGERGDLRLGRGIGAEREIVAASYSAMVGGTAVDAAARAAGRYA